MRRLLSLLLFLFFVGSSFVEAQTNFPNGVSSYGIPQLGAGSFQIPSSTGKVWFVDGTNGTGGSCLTPQDACLTIGAAHTLAGNGTGDTIIVYPGTYVENIVITKDYITLQCAQFGYAKPDVTPASGLALHVNNAQGFRSYCMRYAAPAADTDLIRQEGNGFFYVGNVFDGDATMGNAKALLRLKGDDDDDSYTASEGYVEHNLFRSSGGVDIVFQGAEAPGNGVGVSDTIIGPGNIFDRTDQVSIVTQDNDGTDATYSAQFVKIVGNYFMDKNATAYIDFTTANGGAAGDQSCIIAGNYFADDALDGTKIAITGTACAFVGNFDTVGVQDGSAFD